MSYNDTITRNGINELRKEGKSIYVMGYCAAQHLFPQDEREAYNAGTFGWNYDMFIVDNAVFLTGYRPDRGIQIPTSFVAPFEARACEVYHKYTDYEMVMSEVERIQEEFAVAVEKEFGRNKKKTDVNLDK